MPPLSQSYAASRYAQDIAMAPLSRRTVTRVREQLWADLPARDRTSRMHDEPTKLRPTKRFTPGSFDSGVLTLSLFWVTPTRFELVLPA